MFPTHHAHEHGVSSARARALLTQPARAKSRLLGIHAEYLTGKVLLSLNQERLSSKYRAYLAYLSVAAVARRRRSSTTTRPSRSRVSRTEVDYRRLHQGTLANEEVPRQTNARGSGAQEAQLNTILEAVAGVRESVDERFALMQEAIANRSDIEQIRATISEELSSAVQDRLKPTVQREIVNAIRDEVTRTVQQQGSEVVRREVKSVVQHEVMNLVEENVAAIIQQRVTSIVKEQVTTIVQQQVTSIVQQQVTTIVLEQVTTILEKQLSSIQLSSPNPSYADVARAPPGSHPSNSRTLSNQTTPSTLTDTLYCTVDVSNVEEAVRGGGKRW
jgi:hypothetical protein